MLKITDFIFNDLDFVSEKEYECWSPDDPEYMDEWIKVLVGREEGEGHWFQIHICTFQSMHNIHDKNYLFHIPYWSSIQELTNQLNKFISDTLPKSLNLDEEYDYGLAIENLSKYWFWEYSTYK